MFTGIVEAIGTVSSLEPLDNSAAGGGGTSLTIANADPVLKDASLGDSICVNGTCLTITSLPGVTPHSSFTVGIAPETLRRTNLGSLHHGSFVNLEPALLPSTRLGGHFLQGHVDTTAIIIGRHADGNAVTLRLQPERQDVMRYVVEKGFIALDGASLTITKEGYDDSRGWFEVMLIAYTQERIVTAAKGNGDLVNVEVDMVGKYVEKSVAGYFEGDKGGGDLGALRHIVNRMVEEKLKSR